MTEPSSSQDKFYALLDKYNQGIEPLESWESLDLAELETLINTELQERSREGYEKQIDYDYRDHTS